MFQPYTIPSIDFLIQSSLLKYWEFEPPEHPAENGKRTKDSEASSDRTKLNSSSPSPQTQKSRWTFKGKEKKLSSSDAQQSQEMSSSLLNSNVREKEHDKATKRIPVVFFDEAHKLWVHRTEVIYGALIRHHYSPALIQSSDAMKCLLDSMLVLTKQDRLCHIIHATSDPFYQTWLRQLNVMQHCKVRIDNSHGFQELISVMGLDYHHRGLHEGRDAHVLC